MHEHIVLPSLGMLPNNRGWKLLDIEEGKIVVSRDVRFNEGSFTHRGPMLMKALGLDENYVEEEGDFEDFFEQEQDVWAMRKQA